MLVALTRTLASLARPEILRLALAAIAGAVTGLAALVAALIWVVYSTSLFSWWWLDWLVDALGSVVVIVLSWLVFPAVLGLLAGLLADPVIDAIEGRDYPQLPPPRARGWAEDLASGLTTFVTVAGLGLLLALVGLMLAFLPVINLVPYYLVTGWLAGRELMEPVALRRLDPAAWRRWRADNPGRLLGAGVVIMLVSTMPLLAFLAPVIATALCVHLFHRWVPSLPPGARP